MAFQRRMYLENLESRRLLAGDCFQNPLDFNDVNNDRAFTISDTRIVFSQLIGGTSAEAAEGEPDTSWFLDVNGDGNVTIADLRVIFNNTLAELDNPAVDDIVADIAEALESSDTIDDLLDHWRGESGDSIADVIDDLLAGAGDRLTDLRDDLQAYLDEHAADLDSLYDELDLLVDTGLADSDEALADLRMRLDSLRQELQTAAEDRFADYLDGTRLRDKVNELLDEFGIDGWRDDIYGFIDDVEAGVVTLTPDAQTLFDLLTSDDLELSLSTLGDLDREDIRSGIVDILDAYEGSGRQLPAEAIELRDALEDGETLLGYLMGRFPFNLGGWGGLF